VRRRKARMILSRRGGPLIGLARKTRRGKILPLPGTYLILLYLLPLIRKIRNLEK
jgi:hypothetical protein